MRALLLTADGPQLQSDYPTPQPGDGEALIRVRLAGVCSTDLQLVAGYKGGYRGVLGHEFVGDVVAAPGNDMWIGRRVVGELNIGCGDCALCRRGLGKHCRQRQSLGILNRDGAFADYLTLPVANLHAVPDELSDEQAVFVEPLAAALKGAQQIGFTIISLTFSLIAVLIPLLFMGDVVGRLFREFAITLAVAILISAVVSLTLTPMLCARLLKDKARQAPGRLFRASERFLDALAATYGRALTRVLEHQALTLLVAAITLVLTVLLWIAVPKGFFPAQDTGLLQGITQAPASVSFQAMSDRSQRLAAVIETDPAVASLTSFIGVDGTNATLNAGRLLINLKPLEQRGERAPAVMARLLERAREVDGIELSLQPVQDLSIEDRISKAPYQFTLQDTDPAKVAEWVPKLTERLRALPQLATVGNDLQDGGLQAYVDIDRDTAGRLGLSVQQVGNALYNAFGQRLVSTIFTQSNQYRVVLEVDPALARGMRGIDAIHLVQPGGGALPLSAIARVYERQAPLVISRLSQFPSSTISFAVASGHSLGEAVEAIRATQAELGLPASMTSAFQGAARAFEASLANTLLLVLAAIVTMYIVLGVLYESFIHPVTILSTLPSAAIGALAALILAGSELSIVAIIGVILLIGIVKKNAILMIDFALDAERRRGMAPREAIYQACLLRFRPIMMTTFAALFAALPLMLGSGTGSELRNPLGLVSIPAS